jgi:hypothetical protein
MKELKLPKYVAGMSYRDFETKYLTVAGTRGRSKDALEGKFIGQLGPFNNVRGTMIRHMSNTQEAIDNENTRAFADLISSMPNGKLTTVVADSTTDEYPEGCAGTAWKNLMEEIGRKSADDKRRLKELFESEQELSSRKNPAKYIDKLIQVQKELRSKYNYQKNDEDVIDQVLKVVNDKFEGVVDQIMKDRRDNLPITLSSVRESFNEKHLFLKRKRGKKGKKKVEISDDSSENEKEEADKALQVMVGSRQQNTQGGFAMVNQGYGQPRQFPYREGPRQGVYQPFVRKFKGRCHNCGKQGHKSSECPEKIGSSAGRGGMGQGNRMRCPHCDKNTHPPEKCWELEQNAMFRLARWVSIHQVH